MQRTSAPDLSQIVQVIRKETFRWASMPVHACLLLASLRRAPRHVIDWAMCDRTICLQYLHRKARVYQYQGEVAFLSHKGRHGYDLAAKEDANTTSTSNAPRT